MIDPVSGFPYPEVWVRLCTDEAARDLARSGFGVLTANGTVLRRGFTTGTTAAALPPRTRVAVCEDLGYPSERIAEGTAEHPPVVQSRLFCVVAGY